MRLHLQQGNWCGSGSVTLSYTILLRGIQLTHVQRYLGSNVKMLFSYKTFTFHEANTFVALPNAFPSIITTIMDHKVSTIYI
jgi:hypothetical protein